MNKLLRNILFLLCIGFYFTSLDPVLGQADICSGSLGENIFVAGDFGSGTDVILQTDPNIAPGYTYQRNPPPEDGFYNITNNTGRWSFNYQTWLNIGDNSGDTDGYMMVVNASFSPGLFYIQEVTGLCENTLYVFSADVINLIRTGVADHILPNVSFLIDSVDAFSSGAIPQDEIWHTYGFTFTTNPGQTSIQLSLRNNAPGGFGNDLALDNISFRPCGPGTFILPEEVANICEDGNPIDLDATIEGDQYDTPQIQWQESLDEGATWSDIPGATALTHAHSNLQSGFYYYRFLLANSVQNLTNSRCRSISNVKVVHVIPKFYNVIDSICEGSVYDFGISSLNVSGTYVDSLISSIGCDSIVSLNLTIVPDTEVGASWDLVDPRCHDTQDGSISINPDLSIDSPFQIFLDSSLLSDPFVVDNLGGQDYELRVEDRFGCQLIENLTLNAPEPFVVEIGRDTVIAIGQSFSIDVQTNYTIQSTSWNPATLSCGDPCSFIEWLPSSDLKIVLMATSDQGCTASDSFNLQIIQDRTIQFPNVFSPNGDGLNDFFNGYGRIPNIQLIESLQIYDRWGNLLYVENQLLPNSQSGWNGEVRGQKVSPGVYVYLASVRFLDGEVLHFTGDVTVVR